jgi:hypothetical protein
VYTNVLLAVTFAPPKVGGVRNHDIGTRLGEAVRFQFDVLKRRPELVQEGLEPAATAIDALERPSRSRPVKFPIGAIQGHQRRQVSSVQRFDRAPNDLQVLL